MGDVKRGAVEGRAPPSEVVEPYNAVVFGSTGAVGKEVVKALAESDKCTSVVAVVRRATQVSEWRVGKDGTNSKFNKVEVKRINYDTLETSLPEPQMRGKQVSFYCLGTTRRDAGSAAAFRKGKTTEQSCVDLDYLVAVCKLCRVAGVDHFSVVSSQGASTNSPLLYPKTKGRGEKVVKEAGYPHTSIWKPGLLGRGDKARGVEKMTRFLITPMPAETLARAMVVDAESKLGAEPEEQAAVFSNKDMRRLAALFGH